MVHLWNKLINHVTLIFSSHELLNIEQEYKMPRKSESKAKHCGVPCRFMKMKTVLK